MQIQAPFKDVLTSNGSNYYVTGVAHSDDSTENEHLTLQFLSAQ